MVVVRKWVPLIVSVVGPAPAFTLVGLIEVTVGDGGGVFPEPEEDPLPPPQPERMTEISMPRETRNKFKDFIATKV
jgi:hypothetical protein